MLSLIAPSQAPAPGPAGRTGSEPVDNQPFNPAESSSNQGSSSSLFAQSAAQALNRDFPSRDVSFLLLDAHTGRVLASRWNHSDAPIPMGSLLKPFTALAYGEQHDYRYPNPHSVAERPRDAGFLAGTARCRSDCGHRPFVQLLLSHAYRRSDCGRRLSDRSPLRT